MLEIGNTLREARIRKALDIKDVEAATKIRSKYLEALEQNDFEVLPGPTFVKGFLRQYAAFLKLDADALVDEYRRSHELDREEVPVLTNGGVRQSRSRTIVERNKRKTRRTQRGYALVGTVAVIVVIVLAWVTHGQGENPASLDVTSLGGSTVSSGVSNASSTTVSGAGESSSSTTLAPVLTGNDVALVVTVKEGSCWLNVREDNENGTQLYAGTLVAGSEQEFEGSKRYWMNVGVPEALSLSVNGTQYELDKAYFFYVVTEAGVEPSQ